MAKTIGGVRGNLRGRSRGVFVLSVLITGIKAKEKVQTVINDIQKQGFSKEKPFKIGSVERRMIDFAKKNNITLGSKEMYMSAHSIAHSLRDVKVEKGIVISKDDLVTFPQNRYNMDLYFDNTKSNFIYSDNKNKYIVEPNYTIKMGNGKEKVVLFITAQKLNENENFNGRNFIKINR